MAEIPFEVFPTRVGVNRSRPPAPWPPPCVFPTRVGVNRTICPLICGCTWRIPHACGGEPQAAALRLSMPVYSPRVWG